MKQNDILKEVAKSSFKLLLAQDMENIRLQLRVIAEDIETFNEQVPDLIEESTLNGVKNMNALLNVYSDALIKESEKELLLLSEKLGESDDQ